MDAGNRPANSLSTPIDYRCRRHRRLRLKNKYSASLEFGGRATERRSTPPRAVSVSKDCAVSAGESRPTVAVALRRRGLTSLPISLFQHDVTAGVASVCNSDDVSASSKWS